MDQREKLIELISPLMLPQNAFLPTTAAEYLIEHGVVVLPCRCCECYHGEFDDVDTIWCRCYDTTMPNNGFCDYAKRKGGDE